MKAILTTKDDWYAFGRVSGLTHEQTEWFARAQAPSAPATRERARRIVIGWVLGKSR